ncbi:response regulator transcription factor [[Pseudomonas] carboxydohydrogena]|uniref:Response regulator transcription factor n=1 Tax=Afipia carboxydohydrogena TaxID=290 RepID=A0ABY8BQZ9_AFICR|nr:response regulator transcription factor [[Pseudomonas] carboxydohydrogena]WEF51329.1 response regulator transcription factor [[Pseudomonas] carboxydohydrogena]
MRTLLIEDDRMIGEAIQQALKDAAYAVDWVRDVESAMLAAKSEKYAIALLDLGLPVLDGREFLRALRNQQLAIPVIVVTAQDDVESKVDGLDLGADDYITKPFDMRELLARMRAILRREKGTPATQLSNGILRLDPGTFEASYRGKNVTLTSREFALLHALLVRPGVIVSRNELEKEIYGWNEEVGSNAVEFFIHSIRRKFDTSIIRNVRGIGWMVDRQ